MSRKKVLHISTECYPAATAGGMGDVVGALPIYLPKFGIDASVIIPKYANAWISKQKTKILFESSFILGSEKINFAIEERTGDDLGFTLYFVDIPGKFDRANVYLAKDGNAYPDEIKRYISFQRSVLEYLIKGKQSFDLLHCHDWMTGLIPAMAKEIETPCLFTVQNPDTAKSFLSYIERGMGRTLLCWVNMISRCVVISETRRQIGLLRARPITGKNVILFSNELVELIRMWVAVNQLILNVCLDCINPSLIFQRPHFYWAYKKSIIDNHELRFNS